MISSVTSKRIWPNLKAAEMNAQIQKFIQEHVLFKDYANNQDFMTSLISFMKPRLYVDGDFIIKKVSLA